MDRSTRRVSFALIALLVFSASAQADEWISLFNGKDLSGWAGKSGFWSVKDGAIFGQTTKDKPTKGNTFLVWQGGDVGASARAQKRCAE